MSLKKLMAGIMAGAMVLGSVMSVSAADTSDVWYTSLSLDNSIEVDISYDDYFACTFTPEETGYYSLTSVGDYDVEVYLYDEEGFRNRDEEKGGELNWSAGSALIYELTAGQTYYYVISPWDEFDVTVTLTLTKSDVDLTGVVKDVELVLDNTTFDSEYDIELSGSVVITYADGNQRSYSFSSLSDFYFDWATDNYENQYYVDYYGGDICLTENGLAYGYWAYVQVYDATIEDFVRDDVALTVGGAVAATELSLNTASVTTASGYADQWFTFTASATGNYCFLANVLSTSASLSSIEYSVYCIYYVNADGEVCTLYADYDDNGELTYVSDGNASYPVLALTEGVTYYINAWYSDDYEGGSSELSLTVMYADEVNTSASSTENGTEDDTSASDAADGSSTGDDTSDSSDSTSSASDKNTGDVAGNTTVLLLICAAGLLVLSRRNAKEMK